MVLEQFFFLNYDYAYDCAQKKEINYEPINNRTRE